ncbi:MAG: hypothetical protein IIW35_02455, partial [Bacteroidaceae bacterium]|nr:hypothetical protein [Bacteroidaceae bacterium]
IEFSVCKDRANERNASLLAGYIVSAAYVRSIHTAKKSKFLISSKKSWLKLSFSTVYCVNIV